MEATLRIAAAMAELPRLTGWLDARVAALGLAERETYALRLCIDELAANILLHSTAANLQVTVDPAPLRLVVEDDGTEFDPTMVVEGARPGSLDDAEPGGLGLMLARRYSRSIAFARSDGWNRVVVVL